MDNCTIMTYVYTIDRTILQFKCFHIVLWRPTQLTWCYSSYSLCRQQSFRWKFTTTLATPLFYQEIWHSSKSLTFKVRKTFLEVYGFSLLFALLNSVLPFIIELVCFLLPCILSLINMVFFNAILSSLKVSSKYVRSNRKCIWFSGFKYLFDF